MKIAVNTRLLLANKLEGIGWFTFETLKRITKNHPEHEFIFIFDRPYSKAFIFSDNITPVVAAPPTRHPFLWYLWFEFVVPRVLKKHQADLFLSTDGYISLRTNVKTLDVIHDINFAHRPKDLPWLMRKYYNHYFPKFAQKCQRIATVSEYSKNDIAKTYGIDPTKIDVVFNGSNAQYQPVSEQIKAQTKATYTGSEDYFLFVGALHPRKNIAKLLVAFDQFKKQSGSSIKLVIVGGKMFKNGDLFNTFQQLAYKQDVIFTGRLSAADLSNVMASALALTYVPLFEGFGIPVLEAFYAEIPVIASNVTSVPEVSGNAALLVNPEDTHEIANAMEQLANNPDLRDQLIKQARIQREKFSWDKTAEALWQSIEKTKEQ